MLHIRHTAWELFQNRDMQNNLKKYSKQLHERSVEDGHPKRQLWWMWELIRCSLIYGITYNEYFYFKFYGRSKESRKTFFGTFQEYYYAKHLNSPKYKDIFWDKEKFLKKFSSYIRRSWCDISEKDKIRELFSKNNRLVLKGQVGSCGNSVDVVDTSNFADVDALIEFMHTKNWYWWKKRCTIIQLSASSMTPH